MKTLLKVMSIIYIVFAGLLILLGILLMAGSSFLVGTAFDTGNPDADSLLSFLFIFGAAAGFIVILAAAGELLIGIFGLKGCGGSKGLLTAAIVLALIGAVFSVISIITSISSGDFSIGLLGGLALQALFLIGAFGTRKEL